MNKKLLLGLGSTLILSAPILVATSCGDNGVKSSGYQLIKDETDANKITIRIDGQNLSTNSADWEITESNNNHAASNVWTLETTKSNSNSVYFSATKDETKGNTYSFSCNGTKMILNFSTPLPPTSISLTNGQNAFKGYQGSSQNPESSSQNEAIISFTDPASLTVNFEFKNTSSTSQTPEFMKLTLPSQLGNVFENYQGYNPNANIKWSLKDANSNFEIINNTLISTKAIDLTTIQNVTLIGSISMNGWEDTFEIKVNFSNQAQDIQISSVTSKIEQDKVVVTVVGSKLPIDITKWKFKENNVESSEWTLSSSPSATETQVTFEATYANVIGKTFIIEGIGAENTASKSFTVPVSKISSINSEMTDEGNLVLTVSGTDLSSTKSLYVFNFVQAAPLATTYANPSIDVNQIDLTWTNSTQIVFTIEKQNAQQQVLTKDLYGAKFSLQIKDQTPVTEFTFSDYIAPTAIIKDQFFTNVHEGTSDSDITTPVSLDKITGGNLSYTITTSTANDKFVSISLPKSDGSTNIFSFLSGQKGFTTSGNSTTLTWSIPDDQTSNWEYDEISSTLKNKNELTTDNNITIAVTGIITDTITSRAKTFTLNLTLVLYDPNSVINEPIVSWVNDAGSEDKGKKIKVTFTGKGLSTNQDDWTITAKDSSSSTLPTWTIDPTSSTTSVSFTIEFNKDTMGKSYTFSVKDIEGTKDVAIPYTTLTSIDSNINKDGDLILTFTGDNLSANLDTYIFTYKNSGTTTFDGEITTPPTIDDAFKQNIDVVWTNEKSITLTIQKVRGDGSQTVMTLGLYGLTYEVNVINQTTKVEFTFADYVAPTGVTVDIFADPRCGDDKDTIGAPIESSAFDGSNLSWTLTVENSTSKWVQLNFKQYDFLGSLVGQLGFGENNNNTTTLTWALKENSDNKFVYNNSEGLINTEELTTSGFTVIMIGTLTDTLTNITKTFELSLTVKMTDNPIQKVSSASSEITENGDLTILLTGSNLSKEPTKYQFAHVNSENDTTTVPTVDSNILELDKNATNTSTSVQFIIKKIKDTTSSTYALPTAQTKGLYGQTFSVTSVDTSSNTPSSRVDEKSVTFTFADYIAPTSIQSIEFFKNTESASEKGDGGQQEPNFFPLTQENVQQDQNKPFEWIITSPYKSHTYIFLDLPSDDEILASVEGWKGFSQNLPSTPDAPQETYTSVSWQFKNETDHSSFEDLSSTRLYNKDPLTESNPISVELTATITDKLTDKSVSFDIKITFKLGSLEDPEITQPSENLKDDTKLNDYGEGSANTNIYLTVKGSNLPREIDLWNITDEPTLSTSRASLDDEETNSNFGDWEIDSTTDESIIFTTTWSNVVGKKIGFAIKGFENSKQIFTMPVPSFAEIEETNGTLEKGDITFTITGTDLSTDANMYIFEEVIATTSGNREGEIQDTILEPSTYGIKIETVSTGSDGSDSQNSIKVTIPKTVAQQYGNGSRYDAKIESSLISDFYGNNIKVTIKNTESSLTFNVPKYSEPTSIQKDLLGSIYEGTSADNVIENEGATITSESSTTISKVGEKVFDFTITLANSNDGYVKVGGIKNYNVTSGEEDIVTSVDFLSYFTGLDGFTDSTHTSLQWAFKDESNITKSTSLIDIASDTSTWSLNGDGLVNNTEIPSDTNGLSTTLVGTLTDLETNQQVTFEMKITVKRGAQENSAITEGTVALSNDNTNVKVTVTGTNLPTDIAKWKIEETTSDSSQQAEEGDISNNNIWTIVSTSSSTSIEFSAKYIDVVGKKYNFSLVDHSEITTDVTCPTPTFTGSNSGFANNKYDIVFTISGTNLPGDINMYKFGKVTVDSEEKDLNTLNKEITFNSSSEVRITFKKYSEGTDPSTLQTKGLYNKEAPIWFSNESESDTNKISFPDYYVLEMKKEFLGTISTGADSGNLTPRTNLEINIETMLNNEYPITITTDSDIAKFIKFELPNNSVTSSGTEGTGRADSVNFLETGFTNWGGFTNSALTSLTWSLVTQDTTTPPSIDGSENGDGAQEDNETNRTSRETANWSLTDNVLTNSTELTTEGLNVVLIATLSDSETGEKVSFNVNLTVKLGTSSSIDTDSEETNPEESNNF